MESLAMSLLLAVTAAREAPSASALPGRFLPNDFKPGLLAGLSFCAFVRARGAKQKGRRFPAGPSFVPGVEA
jgi:hypothetical protein